MTLAGASPIRVDELVAVMGWKGMALLVAFPRKQEYRLLHGWTRPAVPPPTTLLLILSMCLHRSVSEVHLRCQEPPFIKRNIFSFSSKDDEGTRVVRRSGTSTLQSVLDLPMDAYATCGSRTLRLEDTLMFGCRLTVSVIGRALQAMCQGLGNVMCALQLDVVLYARHATGVVAFEINVASWSENLALPGLRVWSPRRLPVVRLKEDLPSPNQRWLLQRLVRSGSRLLLDLITLLGRFQRLVWRGERCPAGICYVWGWGPRSPCTSPRRRQIERSQNF